MPIKKVFLTAVFVAFAAACAADSGLSKEMKKNWDIVMEAYENDPASADTMDKLEKYAERWKGTDKNEAARALYLKGLILYGREKYNTARAVFEKIYEKIGSSAYADSAMYKTGECLYNTGKHEAAAEQWRKFRFKYSRSMFIMEAVYGISL